MAVRESDPSTPEPRRPTRDQCIEEAAQILDGVYRRMDERQHFELAENEEVPHDSGGGHGSPELLPHFAVVASYAELLSETLEEAMLESVHGTVIAHPSEGGTRVAVPITVASLREAVLRAVSVTDMLEGLTLTDEGPPPAPPFCVEVNLLTG